MRLHRTWKRAISFLTSVVLTTVSIVPGISPLTAYAANTSVPVSFLDADGNETDIPLSDHMSDTEYYDNGTYTKQYTATPSGATEYYNSKQFEWTDKEKGEGKITIKTVLPVTQQKTRVVYAFTTCTGHSFTRDICKKNVKWMLDHYDIVDIIYVNTGDYNGIHIVKDIKKDNYERIINGIGNFNYPYHWSLSIYTALYEYLFDVDITARNYNNFEKKAQQLFPSAIYTSFDCFFSGGVGAGQSNHGIVTTQYYPEAWPILKQYDEAGLYVSSGMNDTGLIPQFGYYANGTVHPDDPTHYTAVNMICALVDPVAYDPGMNQGKMPTDKLWDGSKLMSSDHKLLTHQKNIFDQDRPDNYYIDKTEDKFKVDYSYGATFESQGAHAVGSISVMDFLNNPLVFNGTNADAVNITTANPEVTFEKNVVNGKVEVNFKNYVADTLVTIEIPVKVDDAKVTKEMLEAGWNPTNSSAKVEFTDASGETTTNTIESPQMHLEGYTIETSVIGGTIDPGKAVRAHGDATINYAPLNHNYELKSIKVDGVEVSIEDFKNKYDFTNVTQNHTIEVVYVEYKDVIATKIWDDDSNKDGLRPIDLTLVLKADGNQVTEVQPVITKDDQTDNNRWTYKWEHLRVASDDEGQNPITYTVEEPVTPKSYTQSANGMTITNKHVPNTKTETIEVIEYSMKGVYVSPGETITYTIAYANNSDNTANVIVTDVIPFNATEYVQGSASPAASYDETTHKLTWIFTSVAPGEGGTVTFKVKVKADAEPNTEFENKASVQDGNQSASKTNTVTNKVKSGSVVLRAEKEFTGRAWQDNEKFTFQLSQLSDGTLKNLETKDVTKDAPAAEFNKIVFGKADIGKTYTYTISEIGDLPAGVTKTSGDIIATVVVEDSDSQDSGELKVTVTYSPEDKKIKNTYKAKGELDTEKTPLLIKKVEADGTDWAPKTFDFTIEGVDGAPLATRSNASSGEEEEIKTGSVEFTASGEKEKIVSFGTIQYTEEGDYVYILQEKEPTTAATDAWTYDLQEHQVTVHVEDDGKGTLTATVTPKAVTVENKYEPYGEDDTSTETGAVLKKTVDAYGTAWKDKGHNVFTFTLATVSDADKVDPNPRTGTATFSQPQETQIIDFDILSYTKAGTYKYVLQEIEPDWHTEGDGWTFDLEKKEVTIKVTDDGKGTLTAAPTVATISNAYKPTGTDDTSTEAGAVLTKTVVTEHIADGTEWTPKTFDFEITAGEAVYEDKSTGTAPLPVKDGVENTTGSATFDKAETQIIDFGKITFHREGTYTYTVKETEPKWDTTGWTLDTTEHTVTIEAVDNGDGTMTVTPVKAEIENKYSPKPAVLDRDTALQVKKELEGPAEIHEGQFSFTLASGSDAETVETVANDADGVATFRRLEFTEVGTYEFKITEADTSTDYNYEDNPYITFDLDRVIEVTVEVTDSGKGYLEAEVTYDSEKATPTITNFYQNRTYDVLKYWDDADDRLETRSEELTLQITGTATVDGDEMVVYPYNDDQKNIATVSDATKWSYTFENLPKYYLGTEISYTVEETDAPEGFTLASKSDADPDDPDKTNVVLINRTDAGDLAIKKLMNVATKDEIDGEHGDTPYTFLVEVTKEDGEPLDVEAAFYTAYSKNYDETKTEGKITGTVNFKDGKAYVDGVEGITLKANEIIRIVGLPAGATYTVTEKEGENLYTPVVFGGEGTIRKDKVSYVNFINREITKDKLKVEKVWDDEDDYDGFRPKQVSFDIYRELDGEREDKPFTTVTLDDENSFTAFIDLDKELVATISDASKSEAVKNASASYADSAAGSKSTAASFSDASVSDAFDEDGELVDGSIFNDLIDAVKEAAGKVAHLFGLDDDVKVTWTAEEKEVKKDDLKYYTAGDAVYEQDDTDGFWTVSITNKHELMNPVWIDPPVEKIIKIRRGTITTDETFTFRMTGMTGNELFPDGASIKKDSDGKYYMEVSVTGEGAKEFGKIEYDKAGTYKYRITEIDGGAKYYTYSKDYYEITVEVKVEDGRLKETVTLKKNGSETISTVTTEDGVPGSKLDIAFTNEYDRTTGGGGSNTPGGGTPGGPGGRTPTPSTPADPGTPVIPEAPVPGALPKTGEPAGRAIPMLFAMLAMFGALFGFRKRDDEDEQ